jgi:hypothetical protein
MLINIAKHQALTQCLADRLPFTTSPSHDAIDVFNQVTLLELRRAVRLCLIFKTSFSRCDPGSRGQATIISNPSETFSLTLSSDLSVRAPRGRQTIGDDLAVYQKLGGQQQTTRVTSFLPTPIPLSYPAG